MTTIENAVSEATAVSAVPTSLHAEAAQERVNELRHMRELIPRFYVPTSKQDAARLHGAASVPPEFVELTATAIAHQSVLVRNEGATPAEVRDLMAYGQAYSPLADELEAMAQFVRHSIAAALHKAGSEALMTYEVAKRLAKLPENAGLRPHVADMRRALGKFRKLTAEEIAKRKAAKAAKAGTTTPPPAAPPVPTVK